MAQLLYMLVDKVQKDPYTDAKAYKKGDVISVREDYDIPYEKDAGIAERLGTMWGVMRSAGPASKYSSFVQQEQGDPLKNLMLQRRAFKLDVALLSGKVVDVVDPKTQTKIASVQVATVDVTIARVAKAALEDPNVLGDTKSGDVL